MTLPPKFATTQHPYLLPTSSIQYSFISTASVTIQIVCWLFTETQSLTTEQTLGKNSLRTGRNLERDRARGQLTMGRSCSLRNSGRLFLRRSLRKRRRVMMTAVMMKADTRPARRGSRAGVWCSTVAGRQTSTKGHSNQTVLFSFKGRLLAPQTG